MGPLSSGVPSLLWTELHALNPANYGPGQLFYCSDVGVGGSYWYSNGVRWIKMNFYKHLVQNFLRINRLLNYLARGHLQYWQKKQCC